MKPTWILMLCNFIVSIPAFSQDTAGIVPPERVKSGFSGNYPEVKQVTWEKVKFGYEAGFKNDQRNMLALYSEKGELVKTEMEINEVELPETALEYIRRNFKGEEVSESKQVKDAGGMVLYKAGVQGKTLLFEKNGKYIGLLNDEEEDDEEDEEDDDDTDDKKKEEKKQ